MQRVPRAAPRGAPHRHRPGPAHRVSRARTGCRTSRRRSAPTGMANRWFLDPVLKGSYPADIMELLHAARGGARASKPEDLRACSRESRGFPRRELLLPAEGLRGAMPAECWASSTATVEGQPADRDGLGGVPRGPVRPADAAEERLRRSRPDDHGERRGLSRPAQWRRARCRTTTGSSTLPLTCARRAAPSSTA